MTPLETEQEEFEFRLRAEQEASVPQSEAPSMLESGIRGGVQSATMNFSDEALGGIGAGIDTVKGLASGELPSFEGIKAAYTKYRDKERAKNDAAQQANPGSYLAGGLAGGLAVPGIGAAKSVQALGKGASSVAKILHAAGLGGAIGGVSAVGASKAELNNPAQLYEDAKSGAVSGALIGGALRAVPEAAKGIANSKMGQKAYDVITRWKPAKIVLEATRKGFQGKDLTDLDAQFKRLENIADELGDEGKSLATQISKEYDDMTAALQNSTEKVDMKPFLARLQALEEKARRIKDAGAHADVDDVVGTVKNYTEGMPTTVDALKVIPGTPSAADKLASKLALEKARMEELGDEVQSAIRPEVDELGRDILIPKLITQGDEPITKVLSPVVDHAATPDVQKITSSVRRLGGSEQLSQQELFDLQKLINERASFQNSPLKTEAGRLFAGQAKGALKETVDTAIPQLAKVDAKYKAIMDAFESLGLDKNLAFVIDPKTGQYTLRPEALGRISNFIRQAESEGAATGKAQRGLELFLGNLKKAGYEGGENLQARITEVGEDLALARDIHGHSINTFGKGGFPILNAATLGHLGNTAGYASHNLSKALPDAVLEPATAAYLSARGVPDGTKQIEPDHSAMTQPEPDKDTVRADLSREVFNLSTEDMGELGHLLVSKGQVDIGNSLLAALESGDKTKRDGILFTIVQLPSFNSILRGEK